MSFHDGFFSVYYSNFVYVHQMFAGRSAVQMAEEFLAGPARKSQEGALWGARALRRLVPARTQEALRLATDLDSTQPTIQVRYLVALLYVL